MISVKNLTYKYISYEKKVGLIGALKDFIRRNQKEVIALDNLRLEIEQGEMVGLLGPNGAGKTTLMKLLVGLIPPHSGEINVLGNSPYKKKKEFLKKVGIVFGQKSQLIWDLPPIDTFKMLKEIYEIPSSEYENRLNFLAEELNISNKLQVPVRKLSLGERMKCELIASFLHSPTLLLLDEPTIGLDFTSQRAIHKFLLNMNELENTTIITTSHYINDINALSKRLIILIDGKKYFDGETNQLVKKHNNNKEFTIDVVFNDTNINVDELQKYNYSLNGNSLSISLKKEEIPEILFTLSKIGFDIENISTSEKPLEDILFSIFSNNKEDKNYEKIL